MNITADRGTRKHPDEILEHGVVPDSAIHVKIDMRPDANVRRKPHARRDDAALTHRRVGTHRRRWVDECGGLTADGVELARESFASFSRADTNHIAIGEFVEV
jgi:hypothetical protein